VMAAPATPPVDWHAPIRGDHAEPSNMGVGGRFKYSRIWALCASAAAHGAILALLLHDAAEPLPMGQAMVVELVIEAADISIPADAAKTSASLGTSSANDDFDEFFTEMTLGANERPLARRAMAPTRSMIEYTATQSVALKPVPAIPETKPDEVLVPAPRTFEQNIDRLKRNRSKDWTATIAVPRPRLKPPAPSKIRPLALPPLNDETAQKPALENDLKPVISQGNEGKIFGIAPGVTAKVQPKNAGVQQRGDANSVARVGPTDQANTESEGFSETAQLPGNPSPRYPARAVRRGWQGRVILDVEVLPSGKASSVAIAASSGYGVLDRSAREAVQNWRFKAPRRAGVPYRTKVRVPVQFKLEK
jgi:TonB family protein